jgi:hypothetical protein
VRPTTPALLRPAGAAPGDGSLSVSVVFEPDVQQAAASVPLELTDAELQTTLGISILVEPARSRRRSRSPCSWIPRRADQ